MALQITKFWKSQIGVGFGETEREIKFGDKVDLNVVYNYFKKGYP